VAGNGGLVEAGDVVGWNFGDSLADEIGGF
jgi:hypothetical protein